MYSAFAEREYSKQPPSRLSTHEVGGRGMAGPLTTPRMFSLKIGGNEELSKIILSPACDEAHFWLNGYVNKQKCRISSEANPQVHVETPLHPEKLTVWCALWAGGILLQNR
ncbi:hypothetical protein TNCV_906091 [Trichonephila clavipes]|nr:hypothetical protein TNCV_906091 [Trichonephila clavipes]